MKRLRVLRRWFKRRFGIARLVCLAILVGLAALRVADPFAVEELRVRTFDGFQVIEPRVKTARPVISEHIDPRGKLYYWIGEERVGFRAEGGTDFEAIDEGYVSVTPMRSDLTNHSALEVMKGWED